MASLRWAQDGHEIRTLLDVGVSRETVNSISFSHAKERSRLPVSIFEVSLNFFTIPWSTFPAANGTIAVTPCASIHCA